MKICIITGSNGLVGSSAVDFFVKKNFKVIGIDNNLREYFFGKDGSTSWVKKINKSKRNFIHKNVDIRNYKKVEEIFKKNKKNIKIIIHTAAQPSHDWAAKEPITDFTVNANGTLNLLECTRVYSPKARFIFTSTNKVYGDNPNKLKFIKNKLRLEISITHKFFKGINESMSVDNCIHSLFGVSKTSSDFLVQEYGKNMGLHTIIFRAGCITGTNHSSAEYHGFLSYLVKKTLRDKSYNVIGYKGLQVRDNLHADDLVKCFWHYYKRPKNKGEVYNIGGSRYSNCSVEEALRIVEKIKKIKIKRNYINKSRTGDHKWWISDISKFKKHYPEYRLTYNTKKIITELIDFYS